MVFSFFSLAGIKVYGSGVVFPTFRDLPTVVQNRHFTVYGL